MPRWMRAQSAFGANGIDLEDLEETPNGVVARVEVLSESMVYPCLQSLLWARLLLAPALSRLGDRACRRRRPRRRYARLGRPGVRSHRRKIADTRVAGKPIRNRDTRP